MRRTFFCKNQAIDSIGTSLVFVTCAQALETELLNYADEQAKFSRRAGLITFIFYMDNLFDGLFDDFDIRKDSHKLLLGVSGFLLGRFLYDTFFSKSDNIDLPPSDEHIFTKKIQLAGGPGDVKTTLQLMAKCVRRDAGSLYVGRYAEQIVRGCGGHSFQCEVESLYRFCRDRIIYRRDPAGVEYVQDARRSIESGFGDCDDKSVLLASLAATLGHKSRFVVCGFKPGSYSHVYVEIYMGKQFGGWVAFDPTPENGQAGQHANAPYRAVFPIFK